MAKVLTDVSTYTSTVTVPEAGDTAAAGVVETAYQALANRTKYLYDQDAINDNSISILRSRIQEGEWVMKTGAQMFVECPTIAGWSRYGGGSNVSPYAILADDLYAALTAGFPCPPGASSIEWAIWYLQLNAPTTRAKFSGSFYYADGSVMTAVPISSVTVNAGSTYATKSLSGANVGREGVFQMQITGPNTNSEFYLIAAGVRFYKGGALP